LQEKKKKSKLIVKVAREREKREREGDRQTEKVIIDMEIVYRRRDQERKK
jgi:hypothetical protein